MATSIYENQVYTLFIGYFGRPPAPAGLDYYANLMDASGGNWRILVDDFYKSPESQALFGDQSIEAQVNQVFQNLFGRDAAPAGLNYWTLQVMEGRISIAEMAYTVAYSAAEADASVLDAKVETGKLFVESLDTTEEILIFQTDAGRQAAREFMSTVTTSTPATQEQVDAAIDEMVHGGGGETGQTFALTASVDQIPGLIGSKGTTDNSGDDTIIAGEGSSGGNVHTLGTSDVIDGGTGTDKINIRLSGLQNVTPNMSNVEQVFVQALASDSVNLVNASGVDEIWSDRSTGNLNVTNVQEIATVGVTGGVAGNNLNVTYATNAVTGAQDVVLQGALLNQLRVDDGAGAGFADISIQAASGESKVNELLSGGALGVGDLVNLTVTGAGSLDVVRILDAGINSIDASSNTGGVNLRITNNTQDATFTGGAGDDRVNFGTTLNRSDAVDGGAGRNTLGVGGQAQIVTGLNVQNIQVLEVANLTGTLEAGRISSVDEVKVTSTLTNGTVNGLESGDTFTTSQAGKATINVKDATKAGTQDTFNLNTEIAAGNLNVSLPGVETVNLNNNNLVTGNTVVSFFDDDGRVDLTALNVTADDQDTTISLNNLVNTIRTVDASEAVGAVNVSIASGNETSGVVISGGAGGDVLVGGDGKDAITGGAGNDILRGDRAASTLNEDVLTGGEGKDEFVILGSTVDTNANNMDTITDINFGGSTQPTGVDTLRLPFQVSELVNAGQPVALPTAATLNAAVGTLFDTGGALSTITATATGKAGLFTFDGDTYLVARGVADFNTTNTAVVVKVTDYTGTLDVSDFLKTPSVAALAGDTVELVTDGGANSLTSSSDVAVVESIGAGAIVNVNLGEGTSTASASTPEAKNAGADVVTIAQDVTTFTGGEVLEITGFTLGANAEADTLQLNGVADQAGLIGLIKSISITHNNSAFEQSFSAKDFLSFTINLNNGAVIQLNDLIAYDAMTAGSQGAIGFVPNDATSPSTNILTSGADDAAILQLIGDMGANIEYI